MTRLLVLVLLLLTAPAWAMEHHTNVLFDNKGNAIKDATVYVYNAGTTTPASIYSDNGITPKANPFTTSHALNSPGAYDFYAADGVYDLVFSKSGYSFDPVLTRRIALFDVTGGGGGGGGGGPTTFDNVFSGTNTIASMIVGTGASLTVSGSGIIDASKFKGNTIAALADGGTNQNAWTAARCVRVNAGGTGLEAASTDCSVTSPTFTQIASGTNVTANMTVGTGASLTFSGSGSINASLFKGNATIAVADGGTNITSSLDDTTIVGNGATWQAKLLPSCSNASTDKLLYNSATNSYSCGTDQAGSSTFATLGSGTNNSSTFTLGTGSSLTFSGTGTNNASSVRGNYPLLAVDGGTGVTTTTDDAVLVGNGAGYTSTVLPSCNNPVTSKLLYDTGTNGFTCGTDQSVGGGTTFDTIGSGTNTTATMQVGTGSTLNPTGTGTIIATTFYPNLTTVNAGNSPYSAVSPNATIFCDTTAAARIINLPAATQAILLTVYNLGSNTCTINRAGADTIATGTQTGLTSFIIRNAGSNFWLKSNLSNTWQVGG